MDALLISTTQIEIGPFVTIDGRFGGISARAGVHTVGKRLTGRMPLGPSTTKSDRTLKSSVVEQVILAASKHYAQELMAEVNADRESHGKAPFDDDDEQPPQDGKKRDKVRRSFERRTR